MKSLLLLALVVSCSSGPTKLSEKAKDIEVVVHKPNGCHVVGKVVGENEIGSKELALNDALNKAAKQGATALHVNQEVPNGKGVKVYATAYQCD